MSRVYRPLFSSIFLKAFLSSSKASGWFFSRAFLGFFSGSVLEDLLFPLVFFLLKPPLGVRRRDHVFSFFLEANKADHRFLRLSQFLGSPHVFEEPRRFGQAD